MEDFQGNCRREQCENWKICRVRSLWKILTRNKRSYSNLLQHPCLKKTRSDNAVELPDYEKKKITSPVASWCIENCVLYSIVDGKGLEKLLVETLRVGATYGAAVDVRKMLPHRTTVSNNIVNLFRKHIPNIKSELAKITYGAVTTDLWSDQYKKLTYISLTPPLYESK